jgi:hypothetical protein
MALRFNVMAGPRPGYPSPHVVPRQITGSSPVMTLRGDAAPHSDRHREVYASARGVEPEHDDTGMSRPGVLLLAGWYSTLTHAGASCSPSPGLSRGPSTARCRDRPSGTGPGMTSGAEAVAQNFNPRGNPFGGIRPACARSPSHSRKSVSVRTRSPSRQVSPSARRNTFASDRPPSL